MSYRRLKLKLMVFLAGHIVAMVTYCVTKTTPMCSPGIGQFFDTMIVALIIYMKKLLDSDWLRAVQFKCNTSAKSVTPVQITHRNSGL